MATKIIAPGGARRTCNGTKAATAVTASKADTAAAPIEDERFTPTSQTAPTQANITRAFEDAAVILESASQTEEPHQYSGESDRLLRIAAGVAVDFAVLPVRMTDDGDVMRSEPLNATSRDGDLNAEQLRLVLETVAGRARTLQQLLMLLQGESIDDKYERAVYIDAAEALAAAVGAMADSALGGVVIGDADEWNDGPNFARTGKAVQA